MKVYIQLFQNGVGMISLVDSGMHISAETFIMNQLLASRYIIKPNYTEGCVCLTLPLHFQKPQGFRWSGEVRSLLFQFPLDRRY